MKKIKLTTLLLSTIGMTLACSSCSAEDRAMERFNQIDSEIAFNSEKIGENNAKIQEIINFLNTPEKNIEQIKSEQIGLTLKDYFDSLARQPEGLDYLNEAKQVLLESIENASKKGIIYGIGSSFGAKNQLAGIEVASSGGLFDSIARQPEYAEQMISFCKNILIKAIYEQKTELCSFMIGFSSASLFDSMARKTEIIDDLIEYGKYTINIFSNLKNDIDAYSLGIASTGFYDAVARQSENKEMIFEQYKIYTESLI